MSLTPCPCACVTETGLDWQEKLIRTIMRYIGILHDVKIPSNETSAATKATQSKTTLTQLSKLQLSISQVLPLPACLICMHVCLSVVRGLAQLTCISAASCCAERERERREIETVFRNSGGSCLSEGRLTKDHNTNSCLGSYKGRSC